MRREACSLEAVRFARFASGGRARFARKRGVSRAFCAYTSVRLCVCVQRLRTICKRPVLRSMLADPKRLLRFHSGVRWNAFASCCDPRSCCVERIAVSCRFRARRFEAPGISRGGLLQATAAASKLSRPGRIHTAVTGVGEANDACPSIFRSVVENAVEGSHDNYRPCYPPRPIDMGRLDPVATQRIPRSGCISTIS
jgi:hypothetical protein